MSSEFLRCNYLELIYCKKRGTSDLLSPPFTPPKVSQKEWLQQNKKKTVQVWRTPTIWRVFLFSSHLTIFNHQEDVLHAQRLPTFEALWRRECRIDVAVLFLGHQQSDGQRKLWEKKEVCLLFSPPLSINFLKTPHSSSRLYKSFLWTWCFLFFRHLYFGHPQPTKGSLDNCRRKRWVPMRLKL